MVKYCYEVFAGLSTIVDGADYQTCCFRNCTLVYEGGEPPHFLDCTFVDCAWFLGRVAVKRLKFMAIFESSESSELIDQLLYASRFTNDRPDIPAAERSVRPGCAAA